jgi:hypothetical protein
MVYFPLWVQLGGFLDADNAHQFKVCTPCTSCFVTSFFFPPLPLQDVQSLLVHRNIFPEKLMYRSCWSTEIYIIYISEKLQ